MAPGGQEWADLAGRALYHQIRQVSSTLASGDPTLSSSLAPSPTGFSSASATPTLDPLPSSTSTGDSGDGNNGGNSGSNNGGGSSGSSPLLFFVALGFGVVFTNLWIIVGVKYCFRYNARNRNIRITGEDGEPINLENMPQHPRRRRREKKLMTIDEVNEKFPMMKYKSWVASRAQEGLPTRGGISQPPSRAGSLRDADGIIPVTKERDSTDDVPATGAASLTRQQTNDEPATEHAEQAKKDATAKKDGEATVNNAATTSQTAPLARSESPGTDDEPDEDDQIHDAIPPEALETSGDTCAICIDTLEDDDDVRGLTCGHAFHAVCLDPWLTSRRACCPLCKADYYTPKPRPQQADGTMGAPEIGPTVSIAQDSRTSRMNMPNRPGVAWLFSRRGAGGNNGGANSGGPRFGLPSFNRNQNNPSSPTQASRNANNQQRPSRPGFMSRATMASQDRPSRSTTNNQTEASQTSSTGSGLFSNIRLPRFGRSAGTQNNDTGNSTEVTPSNLEAGVRADGTR